MCEYCCGNFKIVACYESKYSGKNYGYCGAFENIRNLRIKRKSPNPQMSKFKPINFCPMCGRNLTEEK